MADVLNPAQRRLNMSRIRGRDTKPEMIVRRGLHALGLRYRLHDKNLPGKPDLVFPAHRTVIFVHGCFWHGHTCPMFKWPATRHEFWRTKIMTNRERDRISIERLRTAKWRVLVVWECSLRGPCRRPVEAVLARCSAFIMNRTSSFSEITGD